MNGFTEALSNNAFLTYGLPIGSFLFLIVVGFLILRNRLSAVYKSLDFVEEFRSKFIDYCNSRGEDREAYTWVTLNSPKMQRNMGSYGVYEAYQPPAANYMVKNYQIITNMIPEVRRHIDLNNESLGTMFASSIDGFIKAIDEALLRYIGVLNEQEDDAKRKLTNPFLWIRTGVEEVLSLPILLFAWFGLIGFSTVRRLQNNFFFQIFSVITTMAGLIAAIMTIVMGWDDFILVMKSFYQTHIGSQK